MDSFFVPFISCLFVCVTATPNIIFFLTDDQDIFLGGMKPMAKTRKLIAEEGVTFSNAMVNTPLCCPSRSSILTGRYVHNHHTVNNSVSGGCSSETWRDGPEQHTFATYLNKANFTTFYAGKYLNQYGKPQGGGVSHVPRGWDHWYGLVGNSRYYHYDLSVNGKIERHRGDPDEDYLTSVIRNRAVTFLEEWKGGNPLFMMLATPAPHGPFTPLPKYASNFSDYSAPRTASFNMKVGMDKHWFMRQKPSPLNKDELSIVDEAFRNRWRTLLSVDDLVSDVMEVLRRKSILNNTYVVFSSDHGYHLGQFSLPLDKRQPYEFDIRVPLLMMGPGVPKGRTFHRLVSLIDLAPTFLRLANIEVPDLMDGQSLWPLEEDAGRTRLLVTHSGEANDKVDPNCPYHSGFGLNLCDPKFECKCQDSRNNTYACVREMDPKQDVMYCRFKDQEHFEEAYDLRKDPDQLYNVVHRLRPTHRRYYNKLIDKLQLCRGHNCTL